MLNDVHPQGVIISCRLDRTAGVIRLAAKAGCHIITEKPLALDRSVLAELYQDVRRQQVACIPMIDYPAHPCIRAAKQVVQRGWLGEIVLANARKSYRWGSRPVWFGDRSIYGGTLPWIGIHGLDFIYSTTGLTFTAAMGMHGNLSKKERPQCEDHAVVLMELVNGAHMTLSVDYLRPAKAPSHGDDWFRLVGSRGVLEASMEARTLTLISDVEGGTKDLVSGSTNLQESDRSISSLAGKDSLRVELPEREAYFPPILEELGRGGRRPWQETQRGFLLTEAALAARDAADSGRRVEVQGPAAYTF